MSIKRTRQAQRNSTTTSAVRWGAVAAAALVAVSGCTRAQPQDGTASSTGSTSASPAPSTSKASSSAAPSSSPSSTSSTTATGFNGRCEDLLPLSLVTGALQRPVVGRTSSIVGVAEPNIGRLAYLNCQYAITTTIVNKKPVAKTGVEIGVSLYSTPEQASKRVQATVDYYLSLGATAHPLPLGQYGAEIMLGSGDPLIVVAAGQRTTAISVSAQILGAKIAQGLGGLATAVIGATAQSAQGSATSSGADSGSPSVSGSSS